MSRQLELMDEDLAFGLGVDEVPTHRRGLRGSEKMKVIFIPTQYCETAVSEIRPRLGARKAG